MTESSKNRFKKLIDGLKSPDREVKLMSIASLGILKQKQHSELLCDLLSSPDKEVITAIIKSLGQIGNPGSVKYLIDFISNPDERISKEAFSSLKRIDLSSVYDVVINACSPDQPTSLRVKLVEILSDYENEKVSSLMNEILGQTRDSELLTSAIGYFVKYPSAERHTVLKMLAGDGNWNISLASNLALSRLKDEGAIAQIKRLTQSANSEVRTIIVKALNSHPIIEDREIYKMLFEDSRANIRELSLVGMQLFASDERITLIRRWLASENDNNIRMSLVRLAGKEKSPMLFDELFKLLLSSDEILQRASIEALGDIGEKIVDRILLDYERMPLLLKEQLLLVLGQIGSYKGAYLVKDALFAKERWLRINAIEAASKLKTPELVEALINIIKSPKEDIWVLATAISVMGRLKDRKIVDFIIPHLKNEDGRVRANSIDTLSTFKWEGLPEACMPMLKDRNDRVRVNAAIALWRSGHSEVFAELEKMSRDRSRWVRASAVFALGQIDDPEGVPILIRMLHDPEEMVYRNALDALSNSGDLRAMIPLLNEANRQRLSPEFYADILEKFAQTVK